MDVSKTTARIVGALFLIAMLASIAGGGWLESITGAPDALAHAVGRRLPPSPSRRVAGSSA
jgi:hypothetical protein